MHKIRRFFYNDNMAFGVLLALLTSITTFALFYLASYFFPETFSSRFLRKQVFVLISIFINLLPFRTYMVSLKFEKTGRGILVSMFALMILYFVFVHANENVL